MDIPATSERVPLHTAPEVNRRIADETERSIAYHAMHSEGIDTRLRALDEEWDVERALEAHAAAITLASVAFGLFFSRKWLLMPAIVGGYLLQHALQGWCPPLPVFRRAGFRTQSEIDQERYALKALRGDFSQISMGHGANDGHLARASRQALEAVK